jgi:hypothetical protein
MKVSFAAVSETFAIVRSEQSSESPNKGYCSLEVNSKFNLSRSASNIKPLIEDLLFRSFLSG